MKNHWLVKQEPSDYSWSDLVRDGRTSWTGVRNYAARNNLRRMSKADEVLFYHSGEEKAVVGIARVTKTAYPDPTGREGDWSAVELAPIKALPRAITLSQIRAEPRLKNIALVRQPRLSVMPLNTGVPAYCENEQLGGSAAPWAMPNKCGQNNIERGALDPPLLLFKPRLTPKFGAG